MVQIFQYLSKRNRRLIHLKRLQAESKGLILRNNRAFFMVHKGEVDHTYTLNKYLDEKGVKTMRSAYEKALEFPQTDRKGIPERI